jgi:hypothetical protein
MLYLSSEVFAIFSFNCHAYRRPMPSRHGEMMRVGARASISAGYLCIYLNFIV